MKNKISRNSPCPCGSGKKYKKCCLLIIDANHEIEKHLGNILKNCPDGRYKYGVNVDKLGKPLSEKDIRILHDGFFIDEVCFDEKRELINKIKSYDLKTTDVPTIKKDFEALYNGNLKTAINLAPSKIFRVRKNEIEDSIVKYFYNTSELKYKPSDKVKDFGRFNNIGESIFYGSHSYEIAMSECKIKEGDFFTISEYELIDKTEPLPFWLLGINAETYKKYFPKNIPLPQYNAFIGELNEIKENGIQRFIYDELTKKVTDDKTYNYKTTVALGNMFFKSEDKGVIYPSIAADKKDINIAFPPKLFDSKFKITNCWLCRNQIYNKLLVLNESKNFDNKTGEIFWEGNHAILTNLYD